MYLLLGCGDVGFEVANRMKEKEDIKIIEIDEGKVEQLEELGLDVFQGDFTEPKTLKEAGIEQAEIVLVLAMDSGIAEKTLGAINQIKLDLGINPVVVTRVADSLEGPEVKKYGAAEVLPSSEILAESIYQKFGDIRGIVKERRLRELLGKKEGRMAIVLQTNPDPDSIASGLGLQRYVGSFGMGSDLIYDGEIGHHQNRAMVNVLELELIRANEINFNDYDAYALVDVATYENCALPKDIVPTVVMDHHSVSPETIEAEFKDIAKVGATATLITSYLRCGNVELDESLVTALALAILTDTMNFTRGATRLDFAAFEHLLPIINIDVLRRLQSPPISADTFETIRKAIRSGRVKEGYLISNVGEIKDRDTIPQAADYLLRREGVLTTLVYGVVNDEVYVSGRTNDVRLNIGKLMNDIFGKIGSAGGHPTAGGATIPLDVFDVDLENKKALRGAMDRTIGRKFWKTVGAL